MEQKYIYADNAATTRLSDGALKAMLPYMTEEYGNPSSIYSFAARAAEALQDARKRVAEVFCADEKEIFFTSGGTESDNWAIRGAAYANIKKGRHIISSKIEHHAVLMLLEQLKKEGFDITLLDVDAQGLVSVDQLKESIRPDTILVSIMTANNEVGTIQPIAEIGAICQEKGICFHTDAVQAVGHIPLDVNKMHIDMMSASAHKFNGPKGVGMLYIRKGVHLQNLVEGGGQERGKRSGTQNVAGAVGLAQALTEAAEHMDAETARLQKMRDRLIKGVLALPETALTGDPVHRLPGLSSFTIKYIEGESIVLSLDLSGVAASSGSACSTASLDPSHVLMAMGLTHEEAHGSLRLSLGRYNTEEDVDHILAVLPGIVEKLRAMSPLWKQQVK